MRLAIASYVHVNLLSLTNHCCCHPYPSVFCFGSYYNAGEPADIFGSIYIALTYGISRFGQANPR
ncbi:hypothetical protein I315_00573 [Cryptococcus gattii Ru294]|nr:hypothetical protein I315_00573 [Cryptococcus gattii Ru294]